ncbi:TSUP family transporter [Pseudonocardia adelaidensis]|uniref:Probable membrane transporter protein n=1 Tax=Pseudonocardia adelaidensis TaxID=648754 RepID=A0ABP9P4J5_9PSEU
MELVLAVGAVVVGAVLQRSTGLGFALVSGPLLVLVLGPYEGVALANLLSLLTSSLVLAATWRTVEVRAAAMLSAGAVVAIVPGAALARALPDPVLLVVVGGLAAGAAGLVAAGCRFPGLVRPSGSLVAGFVSGFSNVTAGVGGPALAVYGASTRLPAAGFVPTVQVVGIVTNALSLAVKHDAHLPGGLVLGCVVAVLAGTLGGRWIAGLLGERAGRSVVLSLAIAGGALSVLKGMLAS